MGISLGFSLIESWQTPFFLPPIRTSTYPLLAGAAVLLFILTLLKARNSILTRHWRGILVALLPVTALFTPHLLLLHIWPGQYAWMSGGKGFLLPVIMLLPVILASAYTSPWIAIFVGAVTACSNAAFRTHNPASTFDLAYFALALNLLLTRPYRGRLNNLLRQPLFAAPLASLLAWPVMLLTASFFAVGLPLTSLTSALYVALNNGAIVFLQALLAGFILQCLYLTPLGRPVPVPSRMPPYSYSLHGKVLSAYIPVGIIVLVSMLGVLTYSTTVSANRWALDESSRDATSAATRLSDLAERSQAYLENLAEDPGLTVAEQQQKRLQASLSLSNTFTSLLLLDNDGKIISASSEEETQIPLTMVELSLLNDTAPDDSAISEVHRVMGEPTISFLSPHGRAGRILGRIALKHSRAIQGVISDLQWTADAGNGFVIDDKQRIIAHPEASYLLTIWDAKPEYARYYPTAIGSAYSTPTDSGTRNLVYTMAVAGYPWQVVIQIPTEAILRLALDTALPMLVLTATLMIIGSGLVWLAAWRYSRPLIRLTSMASEISAGDLTVPVTVAGNDEIGHLSKSFEEMRQSLYRRITDLALLLDVVRSVSSSKDWSFAPILQAAVTSTQALAACICLESDENKGQATVQEGAFTAWHEILPQVKTVAKEAKQSGHALPVRSLARYLRQPAPETINANVTSALCVPLQIAERSIGVMWVLYTDRRHFDDQEVNLLTTLAGQAAVVYENARLLTEAQSERSRLRAILAATADPIIVVDQLSRLLLVNPAACKLLGASTNSMGRPLTEIFPDTAMKMLVDAPLQQSSMTRELRLDSGAVFYAAISPVALSDGGNLGRVIVLRDISDFKRRESAEASLTTALTMDLRKPLSLISGFANMLPRVGPLNKQQTDFVDRIVGSVEYVSGLLENLVDLNNIELGEGVKLERCSVAGAIEAALAQERREIERREHNLRLSLPDKPPFVDADRNLLVRTLSCLVNNACCYTPNGGTIGIDVSYQDGGVLIVVADNGIGISPAEQMRIFDRFYRVRRTEQTGSGGYGLGLTIVKAVAKWHGGRVWLESQLNHGTRVYFWLPRQGATH